MANWRFYLDGNEVEEPIGWDAIEFTALRMESNGIDQPFSTEVRFYAEGAKYIKAIYDRYFINQPIAIQIRSDVEYDGSDFIFNGFLNLAIYEEHNVCDTDSWEIKVGIIDDEFREKFKARQDVEMDLNVNQDMDGNTINSLTFRNIRLHRQDLYLTAFGKNYADFTGYLNNSPTGPNGQTFILAPTYWQQNDFTGQFGTAFNTNVITYMGVGNFGTSPIFVNNTSQTRTFTYEINLSFSAYNQDGSGNVSVELGISNVSGNIPGPYIALFSQSLNPYQLINVSNTYTGTLTINPGIKATLIFNSTYSTLQDAIQLTVYNGYTIKLSEINDGEYASSVNVLTIEQWLRRCIYRMTGSNNKLLSDAFSESGNGCYWNNALTTGTRIRLIDGIDGYTQCPTSWKSSFDDLDKIFCLGWAFEWTGTEWKIRVEPREYFYQNLISDTFDNVGEVNQMAKVEMLKNSTTLGFTDKWKNIQLSGAYAIHTERNYFIDNKAMNEGSSAKLDLRSNIIAEGYAIEFYRRMSAITFGSASSDRPNDYDTFIIWLNRNTLSGSNINSTRYNFPQESGSFSFAPGTVSLSSQYIAYSGGILTNLYNIFHTPARIAARWWKVLGMHTYGLTNPILRFQVGQYNTDYSSAIFDITEPCQQFVGGQYNFIVEENTSISPSVLRTGEKEYLFKPIEVEFTYPQSLCDFLTLSQDEQYRKVRLTSGSLDIQGFIMEATNQPEDSSGGTTKFRLLMSAQDALAGGAFTDGFDVGYDNG
jgi:hypothetical protein